MDRLPVFLVRDYTASGDHTLPGLDRTTGGNYRRMIAAIDMYPSSWPVLTLFCNYIRENKIDTEDDLARILHSLYRTDEDRITDKTCYTAFLEEVNSAWDFAVDGDGMMEDDEEVDGEGEEESKNSESMDDKEEDDKEQEGRAFTIGGYLFNAWVASENVISSMNHGYRRVQSIAVPDVTTLHLKSEDTPAHQAEEAFFRTLAVEHMRNTPGDATKLVDAVHRIDEGCSSLIADIESVLPDDDRGRIVALPGYTDVIGQLEGLRRDALRTIALEAVNTATQNVLRILEDQSRAGTPVEAAMTRVEGAFREGLQPAKGLFVNTGAPGVEKKEEMPSQSDPASAFSQVPSLSFPSDPASLPSSPSPKRRKPRTPGSEPKMPGTASKANQSSGDTSDAEALGPPAARVPETWDGFKPTLVKPDWASDADYVRALEAAKTAWDGPVNRGAGQTQADAATAAFNSALRSGGGFTLGPRPDWL